MTTEKEIGVLNNTLVHIEDAIKGMNENVTAILEKLNQQNGDLIKSQKDIEYLKEENKDLKEVLQTSKDRIWEELRARDKKMMGWITIGIAVATLIMAAINQFG